jgi:hypothetical protein
MHVFRKAADPAKNVAIKGRTWNALIDLVSRLFNISVTPPLALRNTPEGINISFEHPLVQFGAVQITSTLSGNAGKYLGRPIVVRPEAGASGLLAAGDIGQVQSSVTVEVWDSYGIAAWSPPLVTGQVVDGWFIGNRDSDGNRRQIFLVSRDPRSMIGEVVCNGPKGEDDFSDNRQWVQVKAVSAPCNPATNWTLSNAGQVLDPCAAAGSGSGSGSGSGGGGSMIPFIVGNATSGRHEQKGKLVLLTPLLTTGAGNVRYACENIDPTDNGQTCDSSNSSSSGSGGSSGSGSGSGGSGGGCNNPVKDVDRDGDDLVVTYCDGTTKRIYLCCTGSGGGSGGSSGSGSGSGGGTFCSYRFTAQFNCTTGTHVASSMTYVEPYCGNRDKPEGWTFVSQAGNIVTMTRWVNTFNRCNEGPCPTPSIALYPDAYPTADDVAAVDGCAGSDCTDCTWSDVGNATVDPSGTGPWPISYFDGGADLPAGCYKVVYLDGAYQSDGSVAGGAAANKWATDADVVWNDGANSANVVGGCFFFDTQAEAETCAAGASHVFRHAGGKIGVRANASGDAIQSTGARLKLQRCD